MRKQLSEITESKDLEPLVKALGDADANTLVIFDIDNVIIIPSDEHNLYAHPLRRSLWEKTKSRLTVDSAFFIKSSILSNAKWTYIDESILDIFEVIRKRKIPTLALTAVGTGNFGIIKNLEDWRITELYKIGVNFSDICPLKEFFTLSCFESEYGTPMIKSGIIFTSMLEKGQILEYILLKYNYLPKKIVFVDDLLPNIESIQKMCNRMMINYHGIHYTAVENMQQPCLNENNEILKFQILESEYIWLTDDLLENYSK